LIIVEERHLDSSWFNLPAGLLEVVFVNGYLYNDR
jgi:hypothetical protein